jgi:hypothetical protein
MGLTLRAAVLQCGTKNRERPGGAGDFSSAMVCLKGAIEGQEVCLRGAIPGGESTFRRFGKVDPLTLSANLEGGLLASRVWNLWRKFACE